MSLLRRLYPARAYLSYWLRAVDEHSLHSPFLFRFYSEVIQSKSDPSLFRTIEERRKNLLSSHQLIELNDPGQGSLVSSAQQRTVRSIARHSLSSPAFCQFLHRLVTYQQPAHILEIGTSFGISAAYMAKAVPQASIVTIEGSPAIAAIARETFHALGYKNITLREGKAQEVLPNLMQQATQLDLVFIDGHHNEEATLSFFEAIKGSLHNGSIVVVGDIHWSAGMERAWRQLTQHQMVTLSADVFHAGILFFNPDLRRETEVLQF